jgi:hypothetical protein
MADVCIVSVPVMEHRCDDQCHLCVKCQAFPPTCYPWRCCDTVCQDVQTGNRCVATQLQCAENQNQWTETSTFLGLEAAQTVKDTAPMASADLILSGLKLRFSFPQAGAGAGQFDCALSRFKPEVQGEKLVFTLGNVEGCSTIFVSGASTRPTLTLINEMSTPTPFSEGTLVKTWDGRVLERPKDSVYFPAVDFAGTLTVYSGGAAAK